MSEYKRNWEAAMRRKASQQGVQRRRQGSRWRLNPLVALGVNKVGIGTGGKSILTVALVSIVSLFSTQGWSLNCEGLNTSQSNSGVEELDLLGTAETLFVIEGDRGISSERFREDLERYYAHYPAADRRILSDELIYSYCTVLASATELKSEAKATLLRQFTDKIRALDGEEASKKKPATDSIPTDPRRVTGDWDSLLNGQPEAAFLRIRLDPEGRLVIDQIDSRGDAHDPRISSTISDVRLEGSLLSYNIHFPGKRISSVHLSIIDRDQLFGTYAWSGLTTGFNYELRRRERAEGEGVAKGPSAVDAAGSTASNTR
jgi:hypothetical protein